MLASTAGLLVTGSIVVLMRGTRPADLLTSERLFRTVALELGLGAVWAHRFRQRGWSLGCMTRPGAPLDVVRALFLAAGGLLGYWLIGAFLAGFAPETFRPPAPVESVPAPSIVALLALAVVNPVAEEFLYLGVVANLLRRDGVTLALGAAVLLRVLIHLYQGPVGLVFSIVLGVLFGWYYLATSRLWPVVVAHSILDLLALGSLK